ncbi:MAG TPA: hypothetical protein VGE32_02985 [Cellvibrio sp.]
MAEAEQALKLVNENGIVGILLVILFLLIKPAAPAVAKVWEYFVSWVNPVRAEARRIARNEEAAQQEERRIQNLERKRQLERQYDDRLLNAFERNITVNTENVMTLRAIQSELRSSREDLEDVKLDVAGIYEITKHPQPSRQKRAAGTQPNRLIPKLEDDHDRNRSVR